MFAAPAPTQHFAANFWGATQLLMCPCSAAFWQTGCECECGYECVCVRVTVPTHLHICSPQQRGTFCSHSWPTWNLFNVNDEMQHRSFGALKAAMWQQEDASSPAIAIATLPSNLLRQVSASRRAENATFFLAHKAEAALIKNALTMHCK